MGDKIQELEKIQIFQQYFGERLSISRHKEGWYRLPVTEPFERQAPVSTGGGVVQGVHDIFILSI